MAKAGENCKAVSCEYIDGRDEESTCFPVLDEELKEWFSRKEVGEMVGRAPSWPCPYYTDEFF